MTDATYEDTPGKIQNATKEKDMTNPESTRVRALELALGANAADGGGRTPSEIVNMADQFEQYIRRGMKFDGNIDVNTDTP